jgi:hypothetical protein
VQAWLHQNLRTGAEIVAVHLLALADAVRTELAAAAASPSELRDPCNAFGAHLVTHSSFGTTHAGFDGAHDALSVRTGGICSSADAPGSPPGSPARLPVRSHGAWSHGDADEDIDPLGGGGVLGARALFRRPSRRRGSMRVLPEEPALRSATAAEGADADGGLDALVTRLEAVCAEVRAAVHCLP